MGHPALFDQGEFSLTAQSFAYYEVVGIKVEATTYFMQSGAAATALGPTEIYGGNGRRVSVTTDTNVVRLVSLPIQTI